MDVLLTATYGLCVLLLALWGLHRLSLLWAFHRSAWRRGARATRLAVDDPDLPTVTVQLPVYDERTVVERAIAALGALDYPRDRLEIQVLDDSTDETVELARHAVERLVAAGVDAEHVRRPTRTGYKAGALAHGLATAKGELVAVFDADFLPGPDFLLRTVGPFTDPRVGAVQTRWGHLNRDASVLTRAQSTLLDGHFVIEHTARAAAGVFIHFNGTAGLWRRRAIDDAGGWQHDTLTEDLDLSYRAQLAGWHMVYLPDVVAPAEVPDDVAAFLGQQRRWARGSAQVLRKLGPTLTRAELPWRTRVEALAHLTSNVAYPVVFVLALLMPLEVGLTGEVGNLLHAAAFLLCMGTAVWFYAVGQATVGRGLRQMLVDVPVSIALGVGLSLSQTVAVVQGLATRAGEFVRTPKRGDRRAPGYRARAWSLAGLELLVAAWMLVAVARDLALGRLGALPFLTLFALGFGWVGWASLRGRAGEVAAAAPRPRAGREGGRRPTGPLS